MPSDQELARVATEEPNRLERFLTGLAPEDWSRPSACESWLVSDVVAHLDGIGEGFVDRIGRGLKGDPSEPPDNVPAGSISEDEFRDRLFDRFAQADATDTRQKEGTDLGLNISLVIVEKLGGAIGADSVPWSTSKKTRDWLLQLFRFRFDRKRPRNGH